jgi:large subunit ribosomal protein L21
VTALGVLTGRRRRRRAERQEARDQRRSRKAQRRAQGGGRRPSGTPAPTTAASAQARSAAGVSDPAELANEAAPGGGAPPSTTEGDDLRAIKGLGAVTAGKLRGAGITTWAQIAAWTPDEAHDLAQRLELQAGRIASDDWVGQAQRLIAEREAGSPDA